MSSTAVDSLYREHGAIQATLATDLSLSVSANDVFRKALLLGAASRFEHLISALVAEVASNCSGNDGRVCALVKQKAIDRQFHTYFDWDGTNANKFYKLFGESFTESMKAKTRADESFKKQTLAFIELVRERNRLVHLDFASFSLEKTADEIYSAYQMGLEFVAILSTDLHGFSQDVGGEDEDETEDDAEDEDEAVTPTGEQIISADVEVLESAEAAVGDTDQIDANASESPNTTATNPASLGDNSGDISTDTQRN